jgi:hypothetical protein
MLDTGDLDIGRRWIRATSWQHASGGKYEGRHAIAADFVKQDAPQRELGFEVAPAVRGHLGSAASRIK